jgi:hypothetical protein
MISSKTQILFTRTGDNFGVPLMNSPNVVLWCWMFDGHYTWMVKRFLSEDDSIGLREDKLEVFSSPS